MKKVFLGGTCNGSNWRDELIKNIKIDYFNPVVDDWNETAYNEELKQRKICDFLLYVITPKMSGVYSIAEVIDDSNKFPNKTIYCFIEKEKIGNLDQYLVFDKSQLKSLDAVGKMVKTNGGQYLKSFEEIIKHLNK